MSMSATIDDNNLIGTEENDTIALLAGNDTYQGQGGDDTAYGNEGNDSLLGGEGHDLLDGGEDADTLMGGGGDDTLKAGIGLDHLFGGAGDDIADFSGFGSVTVNLENSADTFVVSAGGVVTRFAGIERILTDGGVLTLQQADGHFTVIGGNDNDHILSGGGNDCLLGGAGDDFLGGGEGDDTIAGEAGGDIISGGGGSDLLFGGAAPAPPPSEEGDTPASQGAPPPDELVLPNVAENLTGTSGNDLIDLLDGDDTYNGLAGDDTALGGTGNDCIIGGAGADSLLGNDGADTLVGGGGAQGFSLAPIGFDNPFNGIDVGFHASPGFTDLDGDGDLDIAVIGTTYVGSTGTARFYAYQNNGGVFSSWVGSPLPTTTLPDTSMLAIGDVTGDGLPDLVVGDQYNPLRVFRNNGSGAGFTEVTGAANPFNGISYPGVVQGVYALTLTDHDGDGDLDLAITWQNQLRIYSNIAGNFSSFTTVSSFVSGSRGITFLDIDGDNDKDILLGDFDGTLRTWRNDGSGVYTELTGINNPFNGIDVGDYARPVAVEAKGAIVIGNQAGTLTLLEENEAPDTLIGGAGSDSLVGRYFVNDYYDYASYADAAGAVTVNMQTGRGFETGGAVDTLVGIGGVIGSAFGDSMRGSNADDELSGEGGNDTLTGGPGGIDLLDGGAGSGDLIYFEGAAISVALYGAYADPAAIESPHGASVNRGGTFIASAMGFEIFQATSGNDTVDVLGTGTGSPLLFDGAAGNDVVQVFSFSALPLFFVDYRSGTAASGVTVDLAAGFGLDRYGGTDILIGVTNAGGSTFADTLLGTGADNNFRPYDGQDSVDGGSGIDMVDYTGAAGAVSVNLDVGRGYNAFGGDADTLISIENARGGDGADTLLGSGGDNLLAGGAGSDSLVAAAGNDTVDYSTATGAVTVNLNTNRAQDGLGGTDSLSGFEAASGANFDDSLFGSGSSESFYGLAGDDTIFGGGANDLLDGGRGADSLSGGDGHDTLYASSGASTSYSVVPLIDVLSGGNGDDALLGASGYTFGSAPVMLADGGNGNDTLVASFGSDTLLGGAHDDSIVGNGGLDSILGGAGNDAISFSSVGSATILGEANNDTITGEPYFSYDAVLVSGGDGDDLIRVQTANVSMTVDGLGGSDTLEPLSLPIFSPFAEGADAIGADEFLASEAPISLTNVTGIEAINLGASGATLLLSVAIIQEVSGSGSLAIYGSGESSVTFSDSGWVQGPTINGMITFTNGTVSLTASQSLVGGGDDGPTEGNDILSGTGSADQLDGLGGDDQLSGLGGNDTLNGGTGADTKDGGSGNDLFYVDNPLDLVFELPGDGSETIITSVSYALPDNVEQIVIADGVTGITITGSSGADVIIGNGRANTFNGGAGDDIILAQNIAVQDILALFAFP
jgi:Ca2+-binding RTX toxin-like protein